LKNVLLITDVNFWAKGAGHRMRISSLVEYLSSRVNLYIAYVGVMSVDVENSLESNLKARLWVLEKSKVLSSRGYGQRLKALLKSKSFDTIIIEYIHNTYFLNYINDHVKVILDAHDIISNRTEQFKKFNHGGVLFELSRETEFKIFEVYDYIMVLCEPDYKEIISSINSEKVLLCPHYVKQIKHEPRDTVKTIAFIASEYIPNVDAIAFFLNHCWPIILEKHKVQLHIYGNICNAFDFSTYDSVILKGYVTNLDEAYESIDIVINPVRFGAGLKIKNIEALSYGKPLVTTTHGSRGLDSRENTIFMVADEPEDFINAIASLIENTQLRRTVSKNARKFIKSNFSAKKCFRPLLDIINSPQP